MQPAERFDEIAGPCSGSCRNSELAEAQECVRRLVASHADLAALIQRHLGSASAAAVTALAMVTSDYLRDGTRRGSQSIEALLAMTHLGSFPTALRFAMAAVRDALASGLVVERPQCLRHLASPLSDAVSREIATQGRDDYSALALVSELGMHGLLLDVVPEDVRQRLLSEMTRADVAMATEVWRPYFEREVLAARKWLEIRE